MNLLSRRLWRIYKEILSDLLGLGFTAWILFFLVMTAVDGKVYFYEDNEAILCTEIVFSVLIAGLFIERTVDDLRRLRRWVNGRKDTE